MLKIVDTVSIKQELLEADGYTFVLKWNKTGRGNRFYWRIGVFYEELLEIGLSEDDHSIETIKIVTMHRRYSLTNEIVDFQAPNIVHKKGIPVCEWTWDKPSPSRIDERMAFYHHLGESDLLISFGENFTVNEVVSAKRVLFGIDEKQYLRAVKVTGLTSLEQDNIRLLTTNR